MSKDQTVAPKERVNIVYKSQVGEAQQETELPLKILMVGDYTGRSDDTPLEERKPVNVDGENFNDVLAKQKLSVDVQVPDKVSGAKDATLDLHLDFKKLDDFGPEGVVNQVPELKKLLELRAALTALKGPLGNLPAFRKKIQALLGDEAARKQLMKELGLAD
ncbi:type VI secretion system contractile sheath small subunit [Anaeromyxobacter oryzisoli]|jgi:type VI secretion system protein ImpB|uniref:type VI secretion system contractile sheath small subunit n=1 Tax=Anaeromyxobacter oryzisoli TaxID=2925408 RepID=UPI001F571EA0|nr:type VI secretion system contractile sheath small subunit [Anaeromyxobacter sp. SG63]